MYSLSHWTDGSVLECCDVCGLCGGLLPGHCRQGVVCEVWIGHVCSGGGIDVHQVCRGRAGRRQQCGDPMRVVCFGPILGGGLVHTVEHGHGGLHQLLGWVRRSGWCKHAVHGMRAWQVLRRGGDIVHTVCSGSIRQRHDDGIAVLEYTVRVVQCGVLCTTGRYCVCPLSTRIPRQRSGSVDAM